MTTLCFNSIENDPYGNAGSSPEETRIKQLRLQILDYGVDPKYVFQVDDVLHKRNTPKVIRCLEEVAKLVNHAKSFLSGIFEDQKIETLIK